MSCPFKQVMVLDFETYWDSQSYTLSKMTTEEYIRDPRFKAWGMAYKFLGEDTIRWVHRSDLQGFFDKVDWTTTAVVAHNSMFDISILAWIYGHVPCFIFDTLSMARALHGVEVGNSLAKLAARFNLPPKGKALYSTDGKTVLSHAVEEELAEYCKHDVFLCDAIFKELVRDFPKDELRLIDMTQRMFIQPRLVLDAELLTEVITEEKIKREGLLSKLGLQKNFHRSGIWCRPKRSVNKQAKKHGPLRRQMPSFSRSSMVTMRRLRFFVRRVSQLKARSNGRARKGSWIFLPGVRSLSRYLITARIQGDGLRLKGLV